MSLAVLARKTKTTAPRFRSDKCFVLNMTGRGGVIGQSAKYNSSQCKTGGGCKKGHVSSCCAVAQKDNCNGKCCWGGKSSRPAPQLSYSNYLNKRSCGTYRPSGNVCCSNALSNKCVWKKTPNTSASEIIQHKKDNNIACEREMNDNSSLTGRHVYAGCKDKLIKYITFWRSCLSVDEDGIGNKIGYDNPSIGAIGDLRPRRVDNVQVNSLYYDVAAKNFNLIFDSTPPDCFQAVILYDCSTNELVKYRQRDGTLDNNNNKYTWPAQKSETWWKSKKGRNILVTFDVEKSKKDKKCVIKKNYCCNPTDLVRYLRINHNSCETIKSLPYSTSGDQIAFKRTTQNCSKYGRYSGK
jgi:hypothetical protein